MKGKLIVLFLVIGINSIFSQKKYIATNDIQAQVLSYQQYFPFGWNMPGRTVNGYRARFYFQNQETDTEWLGGNAVAYKYRFHDPRLGRFLSIDPLKNKYPWNSPFSFQENKLGLGIELEGLELLKTLGNVADLGKSIAVETAEGIWYLANHPIDGSKAIVKGTIAEVGDITADTYYTAKFFGKNLSSVVFGTEPAT